MRHVGDVFPLDEGWVVVSAQQPKLIQGQYPSVLDPDILRMQRDLGQFLLLDHNVTQVVSVSDNLMLPFNRMFHYSEPEYGSVPEGILDAGSLFFLFAQNTAPGESELWVNDQFDDSIVRIYVTDHTYATLNNLQNRLHEFELRRAGWDPGMKQVNFNYLGGIAGALRRSQRRALPARLHQHYLRARRGAAVLLRDLLVDYGRPAVRDFARSRPISARSFTCA